MAKKAKMVLAILSAALILGVAFIPMYSGLNNEIIPVYSGADGTLTAFDAWQALFSQGSAVLSYSPYWTAMLVSLLALVQIVLMYVVSRNAAVYTSIAGLTVLGANVIELLGYTYEKSNVIVGQYSILGIGFFVAFALLVACTIISTKARKADRPFNFTAIRCPNCGIWMDKTLPACPSCRVALPVAGDADKK